jgi:hypothetical protein
MRNKYEGAQDAEKNSLYAKTRFVPVEELKDKFTELIDGHRLADGSRAAVIYLGQALHFDKGKLRKHWKLNLDEYPSVVYTLGSITQLAIEAGVHINQSSKSLATSINGFGIKAPWQHNGANDTIYELLVAVLIGMFPQLYPNDAGGYPADSSITSPSGTKRTIDQILTDLSAARLDAPAPTWGFEQYCFYCDTPNSHDSNQSDSCPYRKTCPPCDLCRLAPGKVNSKYRSKATSHRTNRCTYWPKHDIPDFPDFLKQNLDKEDLRKLSRAMLEEDKMVLGELFWKILGSARVGDKQVEQWDRLKWFYENPLEEVEDAAYSDDEVRGE